MRDAISVTRAGQLHPAIRKEVEQLISEIEAKWNPYMKIRIIQGLRSIEEQNALYAQGRTKDGPIVTNARGGSSYHNYGLAIDFAIMYDKDQNGSFEVLSWQPNYDFDRDGQADWMQVVEYFKAHGYEWGGDWKSIKDDPHLQKSFGYTWRQLYEKWTAKQFIPDTNYVVV